MQKHAVSLTAVNVDFDVYARSSFNRYYYSMFLIVRAMVSKIDPKWGCLPHKSYPEILNGSIYNSISLALRRARKISDPEAIHYLQIAKSAAKELANLMDAGYAVRVVADYEPDLKIKDCGQSRYSLNGVNISAAHAWTDRAKILSVAVDKGWNIANG